MPKSLLNLVVAVLVIWTTTAAWGQTYHAYTEEGTSVNLTVQDSVISVKLIDGLQYWGGVYGSETALAADVPPEPIADGFSLLRVNSGEDAVALVQRLRSHPEVLFANNSFFDPYSNPVYLTETFVANFHSTVTQAQIDSMNTAHGVMIINSLFNDPFWLLLKLTDASDLDVLAMANHYHESALVRYAKAGMILNLQLYFDPNDPYWPLQWHFKNTGQNGGKVDADIDLDQAFDYYQSPSAFVTVAVLDLGFIVHEDFPASRFAGGYDYADDDTNYAPLPPQDHGEGVMGVIAATINNGLGIAAISNKVRILAQKISGEDEWFATDDRIAQAFSDAVLAGARVINCSWGCKTCGFLYPITTYWIRKADSAGASIVVSAGNNGTSPVSWPANMPEVLAVGSTNNQDQKSGYSDYGPELDVVAPGEGIWTLSLSGYTAHTGTSLAAPQVAGTVALMLLRRPELVGQTEQVRQIIRYSSERTMFGSSPYDTARVNNEVGWGRLNAAKALRTVSRGDVNNNGAVNIADAIYLFQYILNYGPAPSPDVKVGDANCNTLVNIADAVYIIQYIFGGGPPPGDPNGDGYYDWFW